MNTESIQDIITEAIVTLGEAVILVLTLKKVFEVVKLFGGF